MPFFEDVDRHFSEVLDGERRHCARRIAREEERTQCTKEAGSLQVKQAIAEAEALIKTEKDHGQMAVEVAQSRLELERTRLAKELHEARERAAQESRQCAERVAAARAQCDAQIPVLEEQIAKAEAARQAAVATAEAAAVEAETQALQQIADAQRRAEAVEVRMQKMLTDAHNCEKTRIDEAQRRASQLEAEAITRSRMVQQAASERLELQLNRLRYVLSHVPQQWQLTETRVNDERRRGDERQERELLTLANDRDRLDRNRCRANEAKAVAEAAAEEIRKLQHERTSRNAHHDTDEMNVLQGLESIVSSLRSGALWQDLHRLAVV